MNEDFKILKEDFEYIANNIPEDIDELEFLVLVNKIESEIIIKEKLDKEDLFILKDFYIYLKKYYIFELNIFSSVFNKKDVLKELNSLLQEEKINFLNLFLLLSFLEGRDLEKNMINDIFKKISTHKEYIYLFEDFLGKDSLGINDLQQSPYIFPSEENIQNIIKK